MSFTVVIPARFASSRLPGKLLLDLAGKPIIQHVYERAKESGAEQVIIATDSQEIITSAKGFSAEVVLTSTEHQSGTDRIAEVVEKYQLLDETVIVNVQGDEPLIDPENIHKVAEDLEHHSDASIATLCTEIDNLQDLLDPNKVKVVTDDQGYALYFSRAPIPWNREQFTELLQQKPNTLDLQRIETTYYCHMGIYAYRAGFLKTYVQLPQSILETTEALEQLRALSNGYKIHVGVSGHDESIGIDTEEDYQKVRELIKPC